MQGKDHSEDLGLLPLMQDTSHILNCPAKPTALRLLDLWLNSTTVADFLRLPNQRHNDDYIHTQQIIYISTSNPFQISIKSQAYNQTQKLITLYLQRNSSRGNSTTVTITERTRRLFKNVFTFPTHTCLIVFGIKIICYCHQSCLHLLS